MPSRLRLGLVLALLVLIWGTTWSVIQIGLKGLPPMTSAAARFGLASLILIVVALAKGVPLGAGERRTRWLWVANGLFSFSGSYGIVYWAEQYITSGLAATLFATFTLWVVLLGHFLLPDEPLRATALIGVLMGFVGVALIFSGDLGGVGGRRGLLAGVVMVLSPFCAALANVLVKRWGKGVHPLSLTAVPMGMAAGILGAAAWATERGETVRLDLLSIGSVLYLAVAGTAIAFTLYFWALSHLSATRLSLVAYLSPVVAVAIGATFLGESLNPRVLFGSLAVLAGVVLVARRS